jgi:hypothetical protein
LKQDNSFRSDDLIGKSRKVELFSFTFFFAGWLAKVKLLGKGDFTKRSYFVSHNSSNTFNIDGFCNQTLLIGKHGGIHHSPITATFIKKVNKNFFPFFHRIKFHICYNFFTLKESAMSKLDELKERLGILKFWLGVIVGVFTAVFGWIVTTYKTQDTILLIIATIFLLGLLIAFFKLNQNIEKKLKEIRDTKK